MSLLAVCAGIVVAVPSAQAQAPVYGETINFEQARKAVDGAVAEAKKNNWMLAITVVGPSGDLVYFAKMDNTQYGSITISQRKARAAAIFRRPTKSFEERIPKAASRSWSAARSSARSAAAAARASRTAKPARPAPTP
jgi:hypothetical protein